MQREIETLFSLVDEAEKKTPRSNRDLGPCGTFADELDNQIEKCERSDGAFEHIKIHRLHFLIVPSIGFIPGRRTNYHTLFSVTAQGSDGKNITFYIDAGTHLGGDWTGNQGGPDNVFFTLSDRLVPTALGSYPFEGEWEQAMNDWLEAHISEIERMGP